MKNKDVAKEIILAYFYQLSSLDRLNGDGVAEVFAIKRDDKVLLEHIKAVKNIFEKAIKEMEDESVQTNNKD